jgi:hypothetical protein
MVSLPEVLRQLRAEYLEIPGLRLNTAQVRRLCGVERMICQTVLDALVAEKFLRVSLDRYYTRSTEGQIPRPLAAKARLDTGRRSTKAS